MPFQRVPGYTWIADWWMEIVCVWLTHTPRSCECGFSFHPAREMPLIQTVFVFFPQTLSLLSSHSPPPFFSLFLRRCLLYLFVALIDVSLSILYGHRCVADTADSLPRYLDNTVDAWWSKSAPNTRSHFCRFSFLWWSTRLKKRSKHI